VFGRIDHIGVAVEDIDAALTDAQEQVDDETRSLLDGWAALGRAELRAGEEATRRWFAAAALARPDGRVVCVADRGLAPVQALVLPVADRHNDFARELAERLRTGGIRAGVDERSESVGRKIRDAELSKAPYMLVVGDREQEAGNASVRHHGEGDLGAVEPDDIAARLREEAGIDA